MCSEFALSQKRSCLCLVTPHIPCDPYLVLWGRKKMAGWAILPPKEAGGWAARVMVAGGEAELRAEPEGDIKSSTTPVRNSSPETSTSGRRWQQLGTASALGPAKNDAGYVTMSCRIWVLPLASTTAHLCSGCPEVPTLCDKWVLPKCFLDTRQLPLMSPLSSPSQVLCAL